MGIRLKDNCYNPYFPNEQKYDIDYKDFKSQCPKNTWTSPRILTKCFMIGDNL